MIARMKHFVMAMLVAVVALGFASCEHKDLCYHHPHTVKIIVNFDWAFAPDADPTGMCLYFYPQDGGKPRRFDLSKTGGEISINVGKYNVIAYNNDTDSIKYTAGGFYEHKLYTRECNIFEPVGKSVRADVIPRPKGTEEEPVRLSPDIMWGCSAREIEITDVGTSFEHEVIDSSMKGPQLVIDSKDEYVFTFYPEEIICTYTYEIHNLNNLKYTGEMCGIISSMSGEFYPATGALGTDYVTVPFESRRRLSDNVIYGRFYTFGQHPDFDDRHYLMLYIWYSDQYIYPFLWEVTDQVHDAPDQRHVHIILDATGMELPDPIINGSGFIPSVDDFVPVYDNIIM